MLHRVRDLLRPPAHELINAIRGHLAEFGIVEPQGPMERAAAVGRHGGSGGCLTWCPASSGCWPSQLEEVELRIDEIDTQIMAWHRASPVSRRLAGVPGIGPLDRHRDRGHAADPAVFRSGREFAAWLGLVPRQNSTGGKTRLGRTSRQGNAYIRRLLVIGAQPACSAPRRPRPIPGSRRCSPSAHGWSWPSPWPTRWRGSPGRSWRGRRIPTAAAA